MLWKDRIIIQKWKKVSLVIPEKGDIIVWYMGINNPEINQFLNAHNKIYTFEKEEDFYNKIGTNDKEFVFSIYANKTKKVIWNLMITVDHFYKIAEFWVSIYDVDNLGKWYGTEALTLLLDYAFRVQWLRKVHGNCFWDNERALHVYKKIWFKEVWRYKEQRYKNWKYIDEVIIEIFRDEFYKVNEVK